MPRFSVLFSTLALAGSLLAGCAGTVDTHGHIVRSDKLEQIKTGTSTREDVKTLLGTPSTLSTFSDKRWYYITETTLSKPLNPNSLQSREVILIDFDEGGKVSAVNVKDGTAGKDVTPSERETPTQGQKLGIIDQFLQGLGKF